MFFGMKYKKIPTTFLLFNDGISTLTLI